MAILRVQKGTEPGAVYPVFTGHQATVIGRDAEAEVALPDGRASRRHAAVRLERGRWLLEDLQSRNGTLVGGKRIGQLPLQDGTTFQVGATVLSFQAREFAPLSGEIHGVHAPRPWREESGVFVCRGRQLAMDREVQLYWLHPRRGVDAGGQAEILRALEEARRLQDPSFLPPLGAGTEAEVEGTFIILRDLPGETLEAKWTEVLGLPLAGRLQLLWRLIERCLERATWEHLRFPIGLPHVLLVNDGGDGHDVFLPGFDLTSFVAERTGDLCHLEHYAPYLPPELQEAAGRDGDSSHPLAATMYNLGAIGYHLLTGQPPMGEGDVETLLERHRTLRPAPASLLRGEIPQELSAALERLLEKEARLRPRGRKEILEAMEKCLTASPAAPAASAGRVSAAAPVVPPRARGPAPGPSPAPRAPGAPVAATVPPAARRSPAAAPPGEPARKTPLAPAGGRAGPRARAASGLIYLPLWVALWVGLFFAAVHLSRIVFVKLGM